MNNTKLQSLKKNFITGIVTLLPILIFGVILIWLANIVFWWVGKIVALIPSSLLQTLQLPDWIINFIGFLILCLLILCLGFIVNRKHLGQLLRKRIRPIVDKVPLLSSITKVTNQVVITLRDKHSFQKVILVRFPRDTTWSVWFITTEEPELFRKLSETTDVVSVFIPTTPNPTSGYLVLMNPKDLREIDVSVADAISFIISMGTAAATDELLKKADSEN